jgi:transposase
MLCCFDDDLAAQITQTRNHIRGLLTQIHPALERVPGPRLDHPAVLDLLERYPSPVDLAATSEKALAELAPRMGKSLAAEIVQALSEQAVVVPGTQAATIVMPRLAQQLASLRKQRDEVASEVERLVHAHPLWPVLTSMPGVGVRTAARLLPCETRSQETTTPARSCTVSASIRRSSSCQKAMSRSVRHAVRRHLLSTEIHP